MDNNDESDVQDVGIAYPVCKCGQCAFELNGKAICCDFLTWELKEWLQGECPRKAA